VTPTAFASFSTPACSAALDFWSKAMSLAFARTTNRCDLVALPCLPTRRNNITYWKDKKNIINQENTIQRTRRAPNWARDRNWDGLRRPMNRDEGTKKQLSRKSQSGKATELGDGEELT
jgi:hypothetical protein